MLLPESHNFLNKILKRVHFFPDRYDIELELSAHIEDSALSLQKEEGLSPEDAQKKAIERMGNADEIGVALNRQHNPFLGYLWYFSRIIMVMLCIVVILQSIPMLLVSGWSRIFDHPISGGIKWADIEALFAELGAEIAEREGSRISVFLFGEIRIFHRPHPSPDTDKGAVASIRKWFEKNGVKP